MKKAIFRSILGLMIFCCSLTVSSAQSKGQKNTGKIPAGFEVRLPIAVLDNKRKFVSGLTIGDFVVLEDGRRQKINLFTDEKNNLPAYVGVLMDTSPSAQAKLKYTKEAAKNLVYTIIQPRKDKAAFMTFDRLISLRQDFTDKIDLLNRTINTVKESGNQNTLYDAIYVFCDERLRNAPGRRAIIVISDGRDTFSRAKLEDAIDIAQRTETVIYIVTTNSEIFKTNPNIKIEELKNSDNKFLFQLTAETGGEVFFANDMRTLDKAFEIISQEINSQYTITYRPQNRKYKGKERKIEVRFTDKKKNQENKIRTKTKYRVLKAK